MKVELPSSFVPYFEPNGPLNIGVSQNFKECPNIIYLRDTLELKKNVNYPMVCIF